jgi:hypothetical protein
MFDRVRLSCEAVVNGERVEVSLEIPASSYEDSGVRDYIVRQLRQNLVQKITEKWRPEIRVQR